MIQSAGTPWWRAAGTADSSGLAERAAAPAKDGAVPFAALLVFTVLLFFAPQAVVPGFGRVRLALLAGAFAIAAHCWSRFAAGRPLMRFTREVWLAAALLGWAMITLPLSQWPPGSVQILFGEFLKSLAVFWLLSNTVSTRGRLRAVAWALSLTAAPLAATGVWDFFSGRMVAGRVAGDAPLTADPNGLAMVLNLMLPLTVALFLVSRGLIVRAFLAGLIALDAGAIFVTFSRGGFLVLATTFVLYLRTLQKWGKWRWAIAALALAGATIPLLPTAYLDRLGTIGNIQGDTTGSAQERWQLTRTGLGYVMSHPLVGAGLGMNVIADCRLRRFGGLQEENCGRVCFETPTLAGGERTQERFFNTAFRPCLFVHNVYLEYAMDLGWPGLGLFLLMLGSCVSTAARVRERCVGLPAPWELSALTEAVRITVVAFAVAALFYPWAYSVYFWYTAALAVALGSVYEAEVRNAAALAAPARAR